MELLEELKHAWGQKRKDTETIKQKVIEAFKDEDYKNVIELCSKLDYKKEPLNAELGYALCYSIWREPGNDFQAMEIAQKCAEYYNEPRFEEVCAYVQEYLADTRLDNASELVWHEFYKEVEANVIKVYENALTWGHNNDALKKRISGKVLKANDAIGEKYFERALASDDNWKDRPDRRDYASYAIPYYKKSGNTMRVTTMEHMVQELDAKIKEDNMKFGKSLTEFPDTSGFRNKLAKADINTLGEFLKASLDDIDKIPKIGPSAMEEIRVFRNKF